MSQIQVWKILREHTKSRLFTNINSDTFFPLRCFSWYNQAWLEYKAFLFRSVPLFITISKDSASVMMAANCTLHSLVGIPFNYTFQGNNWQSHPIMPLAHPDWFPCTFSVAMQKWISDIELLNGGVFSKMHHYLSLDIIPFPFCSAVAGSRWWVAQRLRDGRAGKLGECRPQFGEAQAPLQSPSVIESSVSHTVRHHLRLWVSIMRRLHAPLLNHSVTGCEGNHLLSL